MKKIFVLLLFSILLSANLCKVYTKSQEKPPFMIRTFTSSSIKEVEAITSGGSLTLTGDAGSKATVELYVSRDDWSMEKIKQVLEENYTIDIKVEKGKLYALAKQKKNIFNGNQQGLSISFKISVPKQVNSNLQTSGGSIQISNLSGSQNFKTSGGSLLIQNISGSIVGLTSGGSITAKDCSGKIELNTSGGSINLNKLSGNISASTSGGSVTATDINGTIKTGTSGGSVRLSGISGNVDAITSGGSLEVKINSVKDYVKLSNSGNISLTLPGGNGYNLNVKANNIETSGIKDFSGKMEKQILEGTVSRGGAEINLKSSQRVRLSFE